MAEKERSYLTQGEATEYLAERLPYPVTPHDICLWNRDNRLRGEQKNGKGRVYYTAEALETFIAEDERRRGMAYVHSIANVEAKKTAQTKATTAKWRGHKTADDVIQLGKEYAQKAAVR